MNAPEVVIKAKALGVRLSLNGDRVKLRGPGSALAELKPEVAAHKPEVMAWLREHEEPPFWPWAPNLDADDVARLRTELATHIAALAALEHWPRDRLNEVTARAVRGPLSDLLPNVAHFRERVTEAQAEQQAHDEAARRAWRLIGFDDRRAES